MAVTVFHKSEPRGGWNIKTKSTSERISVTRPDHLDQWSSSEAETVFRACPVLAIRKASLFAKERKRDSEEEVPLKMADLGGGRHPVSAVRSKQLTRRAFWADPTIHYFSQVAVESREGSEELTIAQAHCLGGPDNSLLGPIVARTSDS